jgi:DNA-binding XRE family transcriptional regulator
MSEDKAPYAKPEKKEIGKTSKDEPKKPHIIDDIEKQKLKLIAEKVKTLRIATKMSYEEFALHAGINRNSYYKLEKSAKQSNNYTLALLLKVLRGLNIKPSEFFKDIE